MDQRTHAWIALRALKLLEEEGQVPEMIKLLKPYAKNAATGAWIPDKRDAKLGGSNTQNHVFKITPYDGPGKSRFVYKKKKLMKRLGPERHLSALFLKYDDILDDEWWSGAYKADPPAGKHLANRAMSLTINNIDMLILGDREVQEQLPGRIGFIGDVPEETRMSGGQVSLFFFMLSHFIADSLMPCHCDEQDLSDYDKGLHKELEKHWSGRIPDLFDDDKLSGSGLSGGEILDSSLNADTEFGVSFQNTVPEMNSDDVWEEIVMLCRASFAVASLMAPPSRWPYKPAPQNNAPFSVLFGDTSGEALLAEISRAVMHDAVLNVAVIWKFIWNKFN